MRADSLRERLTGRLIPVRTPERGELCERFAACRVWTVHEGEVVEDGLVVREESEGKYSYALCNAPADMPLEQLAAHGVTTALDMATWPRELLDSLRGMAGVTDIRSAGLPAIGPAGPHTRIPGMPADVLSRPGARTMVQYRLQRRSPRLASPQRSASEKNL